MGAEASAAMAIGGIARGIGTYFGADQAADAADTAKGYYRRQLGETREVRSGYQDEESYWSRQARSRYAELTGAGLGPEGVIPSRDIRRQASAVGRQFAGQQVAMGILGPRSQTVDAEARVVNELMKMAKAENLGLLQLTMRQSEALRRDILGALSLEGQMTGGLAEAEMARGAYRGQQVQGTIGEVTSGLESAAMMYGLPKFMGQGAGATQGTPATPTPKMLGGEGAPMFGPATAAGVMMEAQTGAPTAGAQQWMNPQFLSMIGMAAR